jgi:hypothetical protein
MIEAGIVAICSASALYIASTMRPLHSSNDILVAGAMVGLILHIGFEIVGMNKAYCTIGAACMNK